MVRFRHILLICVALLPAVGCSKKEKPVAPVQKQPPAPAQKEAGAPPLGLMMVVPDDVIAFAAGAGCDNIAGEFEKSILGRIWNDAEVQTFVNALTEQLLAKIKGEIPDANETKAPDIVLDFAKLAVKRPIIAGAARKKTEDGPPVYGFAILDGGSKKPEIAAALAKLEALDKKGDIVEVEVGPFKMHGPADDSGVPGYWGWAGDYLVLAVNDPNGLAIAHIQQPRTAAPPDISEVPTVNDVFAMYVDCRAAAYVAKMIADRESASDKLAVIATVIEKLGFNNVSTLTSSVRFAGPDLLFAESIETLGPRTGIFASLKPVNLKMFDMVDARAVRAAAVNCSIAAIYDTVMAAIEAGAPDVVGDINEKIAEIQSEIKFDIRKDVLGALAGPAVFYSVPGGVIMEAPGGGFIAIAEVKDGKLIEKALVSLGEFATAKGENAIQVSSQIQDDGRTLHTCVIAPLAMMQIMPCWMIVDDHILIASNPGLHTLALARLASPKSASESIRSIEGFKKASAGLPDDLVYFSYTDSKVQFKQIMLALQGMWPMVNMVAVDAGVQLPAMLPSLTDIIDDIQPSVQYSWFDDEGLHSIYRGAGVEPSLGAVAGAGIGAGVMMPALARTRGQAKRVVSMNNLKQIGLVMHLYAEENDGRFPDNIEQAKAYYNNPKFLESPQKPKDFAGPSYIYIPGSSRETEKPYEQVLAYENPEFCDDKINTLFLDGHVEALNPDKFLERLKSTYELLGKEMPEIKFKEKSGSSPFPFLQ